MKNAFTHKVKSKRPHLASHGLAAMVAGFFKRYKQVVGYHLTGDSTDKEFYKKFVLELFEKVENSGGLILDTLITDGGPANVSLWNSLGFKITKNKIIFKIPHPNDQKRFLWLLIDPIHSFKNLMNAFRNHKTARIPDAFVEKYGLKTNIACLDDIRSILEYQHKMVYKVAPRLKKRHIEPSHFDTMRVGTSTALISHDIRSALHFIDELDIEQKEKLFEKSCKFQNANATSWFLDFIKKWFDIVRNRSQNKAFSIDDPTKLQEDFDFLIEATEFFTDLRFGDRNRYIKCQTFAISSTLSLIDLVKHLMQITGFKHFIAARANQDCLENVFSLLRVKHKKMGPLQFKQNLLNHALSQYMFLPIKNSSYFWDETSEDNNLNILKCLRETSQTQQSERSSHSISNLILLEMKNEAHILDVADYDMFSILERSRFIYLIGYILKRAVKSLKCDDCSRALFSENSHENDLNSMIKLREYYDGALAYPSNNSIEFCLKLEKVFDRINLIRDELTYTEMEIIFKEFVSEYISNPFPLCHNVYIKIVSNFFNFRYYISRYTAEADDRNYASLSMN